MSDFQMGLFISSTVWVMICFVLFIHMSSGISDVKREMRSAVQDATYAGRCEALGGIYLLETCIGAKKL